MANTMLFCIALSKVKLMNEAFARADGFFSRSRNIDASRRENTIGQNLKHGIKAGGWNLRTNDVGKFFLDK